MTIEQLEQAVVEAEHQQRVAESFLSDLKRTRQRLVDEETMLNLPSCTLPIPDRATRLMELASDITRYDIQMRLAGQAEEQAAVRVTEARHQLTLARNGLVAIRNRIYRAEEELAQLQVRTVHGEPPEVKLRLIAEAKTKVTELQAKLATLTTQPTQRELSSAA